MRPSAGRRIIRRSFSRSIAGEARFGGALKPGHLPQAFADLGRDFIAGAGGVIYAHPQGATAGAKAFRQGIDVMIKHGAFDGKEREFTELQTALDRWGTAVET